MAFTDGWMPKLPARLGTRRLFGSLTRLSTNFALVSEVAMVTLGGNLNRREMISGRLADALAWMFLASATLKRFYDEGQSPKDQAFMEWSVRHALRNSQQALRSVIENLPNRLAGFKLQLLTMPFGATYRPASDKVAQAVAESLTDGREGRVRLTPLVYIPADDDPGLGRLEAAARAVAATEPHQRAVKDAVKAGRLQREPRDTLHARAVEAGVINEEQRAALNEARCRARDAIQVDAFDGAAYRELRG